MDKQQIQKKFIEAMEEERAQSLQTEKKVWFFRHGQSLANADKNYKANNFSIPLVPLSELGLKQAEEVVTNFNLVPDLIITSSYIRAKQTADHLIKKYPNIPQEEWENIREFTYLSLDRCFDTTIGERKPFIDEYWERNDPLHFDGDGAESFVDFINRTRNAIEILKNRKEKFIVLFSHEFTISAVRYLLDKNPKEITSKEMREYREYFLANRIPNTGKVEIIL
ncbi:MAG: histidine phosphatase family protein [Candidatus Paceibacterota bacterium]|jgi:broad specificity phosphatase PhoE